MNKPGTKSRNTHWVTILLLSFIIFSCQEQGHPVALSAGGKLTEDSAAAFNHEIVRSELQEIEDFIIRYHWNMIRTETGLRYMIYKKGTGPVPGEGDNATIKFSIHLLTGDLVYSSNSNSPMVVRIGTGKVVNGLEEGIRLMKSGDHAKLIVPSHLAFGLLGDKQGVPARAALVYDVELCAVTPSGR
ncbi:MAG: FKBP-type peptidyl-prolyl cis-trans isomerase [Bacteroidales bacterium]